MIHDHSAGETYPLILQAGSNPLSNKFSQYQYWRADGTAWAKTSANVAASAFAVILGDTTPGFTWFAMLRAKPISAVYCYCAVGAGSANGALGIGYDSVAAKYGVYLGNAVVSDASCPDNSPNETWRSIAVGGDDGDTQIKVWENGSNVTTLNTSRSYVAGPISLFANASGANIANSEADSVHDMQHALLFPERLSNAEVLAVHNLLIHQFT